MKYPNIEKERKLARLTQKELADKIGITSRTYYNYQRGRRNIPSSVLIEFKKLFDKSIDYLLEG